MMGLLTASSVYMTGCSIQTDEASPDGSVPFDDEAPLDDEANDELAATAQASAPAYDPSQACRNNPNEYNCTGAEVGPACSSDAYTLPPAASDASLRVVVKYSPACKSAWARAVNKSNVARIVRAEVERPYPAFFRATERLRAPQEVLRSPMVFLGNPGSGRCAFARAELREQGGVLVTRLGTACLSPAPTPPPPDPDPEPEPGQL
jgi:hypothetical protein